MGKGYILVEGHGETVAAGNLVVRLWNDLSLPNLPWANPIRWKNLHLESGLRKGCDFTRAFSDADALLLLRDEDDDCPHDVAPVLARTIVDAVLPFPAALVLLHREYEALFLPCIHLMAGQALRDRTGIVRPGIKPGTTFAGDPEAIRDVKGWLSQSFPVGRTYKPTTDQLQLTQLLDFKTLRDSGLPCFGTLERALHFLGSNLGATGVYPPVAAQSTI